MMQRKKKRIERLLALLLACTMFLQIAVQDGIALRVWAEDDDQQIVQEDVEVEQQSNEDEEESSGQGDDEEFDDESSDETEQEDSLTGSEEKTEDDEEDSEEFGDPDDEESEEEFSTEESEPDEEPDVTFTMAYAGVNQGRHALQVYEDYAPVYDITLKVNRDVEAGQVSINLNTLTITGEENSATFTPAVNGVMPDGLYPIKASGYELDEDGEKIFVIRKIDQSPFYYELPVGENAVRFTNHAPVAADTEYTFRIVYPMLKRADWVNATWTFNAAVTVDMGEEYVYLTTESGDTRDLVPLTGRFMPTKDDDTAVAAGSHTAEIRNYTIRVSYDEDAGIPKNAQLVVREITAGSDPAHFSQREQAVRRELDNEDAVLDLLVDISFWQDNVEIEPTGPVSVSFFMKSAVDQENNRIEEGTDVTVVHFEDLNEATNANAIEDVQTTTIQESKSGALNVTIETESFSEFALFYTRNKIKAYGQIGTSDVYWQLEEIPGNGEVTSGALLLRIYGEGVPPDFNGFSEAPWYSYRDKIIELAVEDGVTSVPRFYVGSGYKIKKVSLPDTLTYFDFYGLTSLAFLRIPGSVTSFSYTYGYSNPQMLELAEGLKTISGDWFSSTYAAHNGVLYLPSTLQSIKAFSSGVTEIVIPESNPYFTTKDGVLYTKDMKTLLWYPASKPDTSFSVPEGVTTIQQGAFRGTKYLQELTLPSTLTSAGSQNQDGPLSGNNSLKKVIINGNFVPAFSGDASLEEVVINGSPTSLDRCFEACYALSNITFAHPEELKSINSNVFCGMPSLEGDILAQFVNLTTIGNNAIGNGRGGPNTYTYTDVFDVGITEITIPENVTKIDANAFTGTSSLETVHLKAKNCTTVDSTAFSNSGAFVLEVDTTVDYLGEQLIRALALSNMASMTFKGPNTFTVTQSAAALPRPFDTLSGDYYVTEEGVLYKLDSESGEASLAFLPDNLTEYTVPASITAGKTGEEPKAYTMAAVEPFAGMYAANLKTLSFQNAGAVTLKDNAFNSCQSLEKIIDLATEPEVYKLDAEKLFKEAGFRCFYNTSLLEGSEENPGEPEPDVQGEQTGDETMQTGDGVKVSVVTVPGQLKQDDKGNFLYLTGESAKSVINVWKEKDSDEVNEVARVYMMFSDDTGSIDKTVGKTVSIMDNGVEIGTYTCYDTNIPGLYYLDIPQPQPGKTLSFDVASYFDNKTTGGGDLHIWGLILTEEKANEYKNKLYQEDTQTYQHLIWSLIPEGFTAAKTTSGTMTFGQSPTDDTKATVQNLAYSISYTRKNEARDDALGADYVKEVEYRDKITFADECGTIQSITWRDGLLDAIRNNQYRIRRNGATASIAVTIGSNEYILFSVSGLTNGAATASAVTKIWPEVEGDDIVFCWKRLNGSGTSAEVAGQAATLTIGPDVLMVDTSKFDEETHETPEGATEPVKVTRQISNHVGLTFNRFYEESTTAAADCSRNLPDGLGTLAITKTSKFPDGKIGSSNYYGDDLTYTIQVQNKGIYPYVDADYVYDNLSPYLYIKPENMETMFADAEMGSKLTITIEKAHCYPLYSETATAYSDSDVTVNQFYTSAEYSGKYFGMETDTSKDRSTTCNIVITKDTVKIGDGAAVSYAAGELAGKLAAAGFYPGAETLFKCKWQLAESNTQRYSLPGLSTKTLTVPATAKTTFMLLTTDAEGSASNLTVTNDARVKRFGQGDLVSGATKDIVLNEVSLSKAVARDGIKLGSNFQTTMGDVMDWELGINYNGRDYYDPMPLVDHMTGPQALLVKASDNPQLNGKNLPLKDVNGEFYYALSEPGTYNDVCVGGGIAESVRVRHVKSDGRMVGADTLIKWYPDLPAKNGEFYVQYSTWIMAELTDFGNFNIDNETWLNDLELRRLYAHLGGEGVSLGSGKSIVDAAGDESNWRDDAINAAGYSTVHQGEKVIYRLMVENTTGVSLTLRPDEIYDELPRVMHPGDPVRWTADKVRIWYVPDGNVKVNNGDDWSIQDDSPGDAPAESSIQFLCWGDSFSAQFPAGTSLYIYVELTFPDEEWGTYVDYIGPMILENSLVLQGQKSTVTHNLAVPAQAFLQKGVYDAGSGRTWNSTYEYTSSNTRKVFVPKDSRDRLITYYTILGNSGNTRLYLNDLMDELPVGFTLHGVVNTTARNGTVGSQNYAPTKILSSIEVGNSNAFASSGNAGIKQYVDAAVSAEEQDGKVIFSFKSASEGNTLGYDAVHKKYYLNPGDAIRFGYMLKVGSSSETENTGVNTISMEFYDPDGSGFRPCEDPKVIVSDKNGIPENNDGSFRTIKSEDGTRLTSSVTVVRGDIVPGITVDLLNLYDPDRKETVNYNGAAGPDYQINWRVRGYNSGTSSINNYTVSDTMEGPYEFIGPVKYGLYTSSGSSYVSDVTLFTIQSHSDDGETLTLLNANNNPFTAKLGVPFTISHSNISAQVVIDKDKNGNETISVTLASASFAIPEGGYAQLLLTSSNPTSKVENRPYANSAVLTPNTQEYIEDFVTRGNNVTDDDGNNVGVTTQKPVVVATGFATTSTKMVTEVVDSSNTANSELDDAFIALADRDNVFRYDLTVNNISDYPIATFRLIDVLPYEGDSRQSGFDVLMNYDDQGKVIPNFTMRAEPINGSEPPIVFDLGSDFIVEYSDKQEGDIDSADWGGAPGTGGWQNIQSGVVLPDQVKSLRIVLISAKVIPARWKVTISFEAVAEKHDREEKAGLTAAWNDFEYSYAVSVAMNTVMRAKPLPVGVKFASIPKLQKKLVDESGESMTAVGQTAFDFIVYEGEAVTFTAKTPAAVAEALNGRSYTHVTLIVPDGKSEAEIELKDMKVAEFKDGTFSDTDQDWNLEAKKTYHFVELQKNTRHYDLLNFSRDTLTFNPRQAAIITCTNQLRTADLTLRKLVSGSMGNRLEEFTFTVRIPAMSGVTFADENGTDHTFSSDGELTVSLRHGERLVIPNVPLYSEYTITETNVPGYTAQWQIDDGDKTAGASASGKLKAPDGIMVTFTNTADAPVPTGIDLSLTLPLSIILFSLCALLMVLMGRKRGKDQV